MNEFLSNMIITDIKACNRINISKGTHRIRKNRENYAIALKTHGLTEYKQNGKTFVSDSEHVCFLSKHSDYSFECLDAGECLMIEFDTNDDSKCDFFTCKTHNMDELAKLFRKTEHALMVRRDSGRFTAISCFYAILAQLSEETNTEYTSAPFLEPAVKYISEHISDGVITNDTLAELCGISCVYFRKTFTKKFKMSPAKYITALRIRKAKDMMLSDFVSMTDLADACGFSSIYHFSKVFKAYTGMTPGEYRRSLHD